MQEAGAEGDRGETKQSTLSSGGTGEQEGQEVGAGVPQVRVLKQPS